MTGEIKQIVQNLAVSHVDILNSLTKESIKAIDEIKRLGEENEDLKSKLTELHKRNEDQFLRARKHIQELLKRQEDIYFIQVGTYRDADYIAPGTPIKEVFTVFGREMAETLFFKTIIRYYHDEEVYLCKGNIDGVRGFYDDIKDCIYMFDPDDVRDSWSEGEIIYYNKEKRDYVPIPDEIYDDEVEDEYR